MFMLFVVFINGSSLLSRMLARSDFRVRHSDEPGGNREIRQGGGMGAWRPSGMVSILLFAVAAFLVAVGVAPVLTGPHIPFFDPDSSQYFFPHAARVGEGIFVIPSDRHFIYPLFLHMVAGKGMDYAAVGVSQIVLFCLAGVVLAWSLFLLLRRVLRIDRLPSLVISALFLGVFLCCKGLSLFSFTLMPDVLAFIACSFVVLCTVLLCLCPRMYLIYVVACLCFVLFFLKPNFGIAVLYPYFLCLFYFRHFSWRHGLYLTALCVMVFFSLNFVQVDVFHGKNWGERVHGPETLFYWNLVGVLPEIRKDLSGQGYTGMNRDALQEIYDYLVTELARQRSLPPSMQYPSLGFNPDLFLYDEHSIPPLLEKLHIDERTQVKFYNAYAYRYILHNPGKYACKVLTELARCNFRMNSLLSRFDGLDFADMDSQGRKSMRVMLGKDYPCHACGETYIAGYQRQFARGGWEYGALYDDVARGVSWAASSALMIAPACLIAFAVMLMRRSAVAERRGLRELFLVCINIYAFVFLGDLTIALYHTFDIPRYVVLTLPARIFLAFVLAMALAFAAGSWLKAKRLRG